MKTLLFMALCAITLNAQAIEERKDTVDRYIIDKEVTAHFDGSQLEGKRIAKYMIAYKDNGKVVERNHVICTDGVAGIVLAGAYKKNDVIVDNYMEALIIVDGKETLPEEFAKMKAEDITRINVLHKGSKGASDFGEKGRNGVILVTTAANTKVKAEPLVIVDGKEISSENFAKIKSEEIATVNVIEGGSIAAEAYGDKGEGGVIVVTLKKENK